MTRRLGLRSGNLGLTSRSIKVAQLGEEIAEVAAGLQAGDGVVALGRISSNLERR